MENEIKKQQQISLTFGISNISIEENSFFPKNIIENPKEPTQYHYLTSVSVRVNDVEKSIEVATEINLSLNEAKDNKLGKLKVLTDFKIVNFDDIPQVNKTYNLPGEFVATLIGISISNVRGILFVTSKSALANPAILPILNPNDYVKKMFENSKQDNTVKQ